MEDEIKSTISEQEFNDLKQEIKNDTKSVIEDVLKSNVPSQRVPMSDEVVKDEADKGKFKSFAEFLQSVQERNFGGNDVRLRALAESSGEGGGFLVPEEFRSEI